MNPILENLIEIGEAHNGTMFLGTAFVSEGLLVLENTVPPGLFMANPGNQVLRYLLQSSTTWPNWGRLEIMKLALTRVPGKPWSIFSVVFKTVHIRLLQKKWKRIYKQRKETLANTGLIVRYLNERARRGRSTIHLPGFTSRCS
jgi:hypothetical protein